MMNTQRKRWAAAAVALALAGLTACGSGSDDSSSTSNAESSDSAASSTGASSETGSGESVTLHVLMEGVPDTDIVQAMLPAFNAEHPEIKVEIETAVYDQMRDKYVASFTAPEPVYNLAILDNPWVGDFAGAEFVLPLDDQLASAGADYNFDDISAPLRAINDVDGSTYGVPFYNYALGLIYRTDLVDAAPATLDDLVTVADQQTTADQAGLAMQPQRGYKAFEEWANYLFAAGGSIYGDDGQVDLNTPEATTALQTYVDLYNTDAPANSLNWAFDEALRSVSTGGAAMMVSYNWMLPTLNSPDGPAGDLAGKFALAPMPGGKQVLGSWSWAIPANSDQVDAAWTFIEWLTSPAGEKERVLAGGAPIRQSVLTDPDVLASDYGADYYGAVGEILANADPLCVGSNCDEMIQAVGTELNAAVAGQKDVAAALKDATEQANRIQNS